jgi:hypothetical protein
MVEDIALRSYGDIIKMTQANMMGPAPAAGANKANSDTV